MARGEDSVQLRNTLTSSYVYGNSGNDTIDVTAAVQSSLHGGEGDDRFSLTGVVSGSTLSVVVVLTSLRLIMRLLILLLPEPLQGTLATANDTVVFGATGVSNVNVTFAEGGFISPSPGVRPVPLFLQQAVMTLSLQLCPQRQQLERRLDLALTRLSLLRSERQHHLGWVWCWTASTLAKGVSSEVYANQGADCHHRHWRCRPPAGYIKIGGG